MNAYFVNSRMVIAEVYNSNFKGSLNEVDKVASAIKQYGNILNYTVQDIKNGKAIALYLAEDGYKFAGEEIVYNDPGDEGYWGESEANKYIENNKANGLSKLLNKLELENTNNDDFSDEEEELGEYEQEDAYTTDQLEEEIEELVEDTQTLIENLKNTSNPLEKNELIDLIYKNKSKINELLGTKDEQTLIEDLTNYNLYKKPAGDRKSFTTTLKEIDNFINDSGQDIVVLQEVESADSLISERQPKIIEVPKSKLESYVESGKLVRVNPNTMKEVKKREEMFDAEEKERKLKDLEEEHPWLAEDEESLEESPWVSDETKIEPNEEESKMEDIENKIFDRMDQVQEYNEKKKERPLTDQELKKVEEIATNYILNKYNISREDYDKFIGVSSRISSYKRYKLVKYANTLLDIIK